MDDYLSSVTIALGPESHEYKFFLYLFKEWQQKRITTPVVAAMLKLLFSDQQDYLERFNQFLPAEHKISLPLSRRPDKSHEEATSFLQKIKEALDRERYTSFLKVFDQYRAATMNILELSRKVCELLQDRQDLLEEFTIYLPAPLEVTLQQAFKKTAGTSSQKRK
ncbi:hypothetical protein ACET3Z_017285 [Daucus carota]